ncbi:MAG: EthD family reductase [Chloroflexi bacterium]|nr:EthD family reductase [Chloroflexota bacterium]
MTKVLVVLQKKADMPRDEFRRYWREVHGPIGARMPGVRKYVQNHVLADGAPFDGVAEMWFDSPETMRGAFTSEAAQEAARDAANFLGGTQVIVVEEVEMV